MNREEQIRYLLERYEQKACSPEEIRLLMEWLEEAAATGKAWEFADKEDKRERQNKLWTAVQSSTAQRGDHPFRKRRPLRISLLVRYAAAAAILVCIGSIWLVGRPRQVIVASRPGGIEKIVLPDGTEAWLNDNSELAYYSDFRGRRNIELRKGEAFFDIKKDPSHPFIVRARELSTTVLGTSFSEKIIDATGDVKISVVTGNVMVGRQKDTLGFLLPYRRLRYNRSSGETIVDSVLAGEAAGWIGGDLFLQNASLDEVNQWLKDHYKVNIQNKRSTYKGEYFLQAKIDIPLPEMLKILNLLGKKDHVQFSLQEQTIIIQ